MTSDMDSAKSAQPSERGAPPESVKHYAYLDSLRGVAFLGVMAVHTNWRVAGVPAWCKQLFMFGNYGVQLFFVLSALTLCMSMQGRSRVENNPNVSFAIRRFFRIAPMYWIALVFYLFFFGTNATSFAPNGIGLTQILTNLFFIHGWYPTTINSVVPGGWSIAVEMNFYLLFPMLFLLLRNVKRAVIAMAIGVPSSILISVAVYHWMGTGMSDISSDLAHSFTYYWLPRQFAVFLFGFALFHLLNEDGNKMMQRFRQPGDIRILLLGLALLVLAVLLSPLLPVAYLFFSMVFVVLILGLSIYPAKLIVNPLIRYTGTVSYSAYLVHFAVIQIVASMSNEFLQSATSSEGAVLRLALYYVVCWGLTLVVATATYKLIELPSQRVGKRLISRLQSRSRVLQPG
jgi:peptidoglycan/LPS O-acetylase OafA/YrhL